MNRLSKIENNKTIKLFILNGREVKTSVSELKCECGEYIFEGRLLGKGHDYSRAYYCYKCREYNDLVCPDGF